MRFIKGVLSLILYMVNLLLHAVFVLLCALLIFITPFRKGRVFLQRHLMQKLPTSWDRWNAWIMAIATAGKWDIQGDFDKLKKDGWYLLISNHQSWIDILVLGKIFHGKTPPLKFFMKKELLWQLPLAGVACYAMGYPFMSRHSHAAIKKNPSLKGKDIETTKKACNKMRELPTTLINFSEGTRFSERKKQNQHSPFKNLLKPRAGGAAIVLKELHDAMDGILNVVITYTPKPPSFWEFACGRFEKGIVRVELLPVTADIIGDYDNDREFRPKLQQWFNALWTRNDQLIDSFKK